MAEILGIGCSHGPIILTPPEVWAKGRERVFARIPDYQDRRLNTISVIQALLDKILNRVESTKNGPLPACVV